MKIEELMVGDLVYWNKLPHMVGAYTIYNMRRNETLRSLVTFIPITPEILEKNGFTKSDYFGYYTEKDGNFIQYDFADNKLLVEAVDATFEGVIHSVHKLQHVLKICDVNKEIIL